MVNAILRTYIPDDWSVITLGNYAQIFRGGSPRPIQAFLTTSDQGVNWIKIGDVGEEDKFIKSTEEKIVPEGVSCSRMVFRGDLILSNSMSYGRPYIMNIEGCIHDGWLVIQKYDRVFDRDYLYYALSSGLTMKQYVAMAAGSSVQNLNKEKVSKVVLPCPRISEQKSIAEVLSDIDTLIIDLKKIIRKKKDIRQGTMQMLVTGKKRLSGFDGNWRVTTLDRLCYIVTKQTGFDYSAEIKPSLVTTPQIGTIPFIQNKDFEAFDINYNTDFFIPYDVAEKYPRILLNEVCLLISISGRIGNVAIFDNEQTSFAGGAVGIAKLYEPELASWCMLYLSSKDGQEQIFSNEKVGAQHNLTVADVRKLEIKMPAKSEREAIIKVLTDMNDEIEVLEEKLDKYQKIKQGMMEELLTGKVRLV